MAERWHLVSLFENDWGFEKIRATDPKVIEDLFERLQKVFPKCKKESVNEIPLDKKIAECSFEGFPENKLRTFLWLIDIL